MGFIQDLFIAICKKHSKRTTKSIRTTWLSQGIKSLNHYIWISVKIIVPLDVIDNSNKDNTEFPKA